MKIFCILGDERAFQSKSPAMFTGVMKRVGIKGVYVPFRVKSGQIEAALNSLRALNIDGANVTIPYKEAVLPHLDILSEGANIIRAVNTIVIKDNVLKGYNTNAIGFMEALEEAGIEVAGKNAVVFGTGGAAKAVVFILNWLRAGSITIIGRGQEKLDPIAARVNCRTLLMAEAIRHPLKTDLFINATSVSSPDESFDMAALVQNLRLDGCRWVIDLNYGRRSNFWKSLAEAHGCSFMDGVPILAHQARHCFALWTRIQIEPAEFIRAMDEA